METGPPALAKGATGPGRLVSARTVFAVPGAPWLTDCIAYISPAYPDIKIPLLAEFCIRHPCLKSLQTIASLLIA